MDFDLGLAVKNSNENPVYYIEYANARISSILNNYSSTILSKEKYNKEEQRSTATELQTLKCFLTFSP